ncbi:hypothetical protein [Proteiniphilum sp. UBA5384]|uniref:hypothetical protein n=1 Tax=Proteiniphilum sp. UBA5384 TaxID=1947279 RepID=UPI0025EE72D0|nr:hypothetical protein [Proteiniphilum sp. UBA5384]
MKKIVLMALVAIFTLSFTLEAQDTGKSRRDNRREVRSGMRWTAKDRAENMSKQLNLTADEKAKVEALFEKQDAERAGQIAKQRADRDEKINDRAKQREEMQALREKAIAENDAELEAIIGKEKLEQWKQYRADRQKEMRSSRPAGRGGQR